MVKTKGHTPKLTKKFYPFVSVCTPTFNRRPFIPNMIQCFKNQTYPKDRMEWIIVDDGTDCIEDLITSAGISQIKYQRVTKKMSLGEKRNYMHSFVKGTIIVYMDDDDYYPPERVEHAVDRLQSDKNALCAGSSEIYVYFKHIGKMIQCGPYGPNHATAGTFAFRTELLKTNRYEDHAALAEEKHFLNNYTVPFIQLDPMKSILVFSHEHNTFDKRKLLENPHPDYLKESPKTVDDFIRLPKESGIKDFFMNKIDDLLKGYEPGEPKMKPDVLEQIKKIDAERQQMVKNHQLQQQQNQQQQNQQQQNQSTNQKIIVNTPDGKQQELSIPDVMNILNQQNVEIQRLTQQNTDLQKMVIQLQQQIARISQEKFNLPLKEEKPKPEEIIKVRNKSDPEVLEF